MIPAISAGVRPVILSGGSGTRLWPMSRSDCPKQMLSLMPPDTLLQATARRVQGSRFLPPYVVASAAHATAISSQLNACGVPAEALILEPAARNTAPAIALAAALAAETDPGTILLVMPSDHVIADVDAFHGAIGDALAIAAEGWLVTFGITPTAPETGYGYVEMGEPLCPGVRRGVRFVEKPDHATAEEYLESGRFVWNSGIFLFRADAILTALGHRAHAIRDSAISSIAGARREGPVIKPDPVAFAASPSESIDYAVMEHWDRVAVVPVEMGWSDIGSWDALHDFSLAAGSDERQDENVVAIDTENCLIRTSGPLVAAIGLKDVIVVATDDAVMVAPRGRSQDVRHLVSALKQTRHRALEQSVRTDAPWGRSRLLTRAADMEIHEAIVDPGATLSHFMSGTATFFVLAGSASVDGTIYRPKDGFGPVDANDVTISNTGVESLHLLAQIDRGSAKP